MKWEIRGGGNGLWRRGEYNRKKNLTVLRSARSEFVGKIKITKRKEYFIITIIIIIINIIIIIILFLLFFC